jgi:hypothetical protein
MSEPKHAITLNSPSTDERALVHPLVARAMAANPNTETLRELMTLQREWEQTEAKKAFTAALVALKAHMPTVIAHDKLVAFKAVRYTHTSLAAAMDAITPSLTEFGFALSWEPETNGNTVSVTCSLTHRGGHSQSCTMSAPADKSGQKSPAQGIASTVTLLQRYTALSLLGVATADMGEPNGQRAPQQPGGVNAARNMAAVGAIQARGRSVDEAVELVGRPVPEWTGADLDQLRAWLKEKPSEPEPQATPSEPDDYYEEPPMGALEEDEDTSR